MENVMRQTSLCKHTVCSNNTPNRPNTHPKCGILQVMFHTYQVGYQNLYQLTSSATINSLYIHVCVTRESECDGIGLVQCMNLLAAPYISPVMRKFSQYSSLYGWQSRNSDTALRPALLLNIYTLVKHIKLTAGARITAPAEESHLIRITFTSKNMHVKYGEAETDR